MTPNSYLKDEIEFAREEGKRAAREAMRCETCELWIDGEGEFKICEILNVHTNREFGCVDHEERKENG